MRRVDIAAPRIILAVGGEGDRDAQPSFLRHGLHLVVGIYLLVRRAVGVVEVMRDAKLVDVNPHGVVAAVVGALLQVEGIRVGEVHAGIVAARADVIQQHGLFLQRHLGEQVRHAVLGVRAPVLVHVQLAVAVQILELQTVYLDQLLDGRAQSDLGVRSADRDDLRRGRFSRCHRAKRHREHHRDRQKQGQFPHESTTFL